MILKEQIDLELPQKEQMALVAKALSSGIRLSILDILKDAPLNISEIAKRLSLPISSAALHMKTLEDAGLIITQSLPGIRGAQRVCNLKVDRISFTLLNQSDINASQNVITESMPIGNYFDCQINAPCGVVSDTTYLSADDNIYGFFSPQKHTAQLLWFTQGYLEYRFSNYALKKLTNIKSLEFSFEICSEATGYSNSWKSDISFWINQIDLGHFTSLGDYGGRRGKLNPDWWNEKLTQFGMLKTLTINESGSYIDNELISNHTITELELRENDFFTFRLGVKKDAKYVGGMNLFGEKFGDHPQNIVLRIVY